MDIQKYLDYKKNSWSGTTKETETRRLKQISLLLIEANNDPDKFYSLLITKYKPYTVKTMFIRTSMFREFCNDLSFSNYMKENKNLFKHAYQTKYVDMTFEEAQERVNSIKHEGVKQVAKLMLSTGMRIHEALKYDGSGQVIGKGGKPRPIFSKEVTIEKLGESTIRKHCQKVGLNPHSLRKLAATQLAKSGLTEADLMYVMGWSNIQTAGKYLQPLKQDELAKKVKETLQS
jgi:integrase